MLDDALNRPGCRCPRTLLGEHRPVSDLEEQFGANGGYEAESAMARLADGLGLRQELLLDDIASLSGGQRRRVDLLRVLFQKPDVMVLDEPTNHLDLPAKRWLMEELGKFAGALLLISHDLKLLDRSITKVLHLAGGGLHEYKGTYTSYRAQLAAEQERREKSANLEGREIRRLSTLADSMRGSTRPPGPDRQVDRPPGGAARVVPDRGDGEGADEPLPSPGPAPLGRGSPPRRGPRRPLRPDGRCFGPQCRGRPGGPHRGDRPQRGRQVQLLPLPRRGRSPTAGSVGLGAQRERRLLRPGARTDRPGTQRGSTT